MEGNPRYPATQDIPAFSYAAFAELAGLKGITVRTADALAGAWAEGLASDVPTVIDVMTDPDVAPLPPHVTLEQAKGFMSAFAKGDGGAGGVLRETARQVLKDWTG